MSNSSFWYSVEMYLPNPWMQQFPELESFATTIWSSYEVLSMDQVHGDRVVIITDSWQIIGEADGIVTRLENVSLSVHTADCGNIVAYDPFNRIIGVCHTGWRWTHLDIIKKLIESMLQLGSWADSIVVRWWPSLCPYCHQFRKQIEWLFDDRYYDEWGLLHLHVIRKDQLLQSGISDQNIVLSDVCTMCSNYWLPSYKRDATDQRMVTIARMLIRDFSPWK